MRAGPCQELSYWFLIEKLQGPSIETKTKRTLIDFRSTQIFWLWCVYLTSGGSGSNLSDCHRLISKLDPSMWSVDGYCHAFYLD
jgi:hypothetical protein